VAEPDEPDATAAEATDAGTTEAAAGLDVPALLGRVEKVLLGGPRRYTRLQVAEVADVEVDHQQLWRSLGFATVGDDEIVFTDADVQALRQVKFLVDNGLADDELRSGMTRLLGQTFARLASWQGQLLIELIGKQPELLASEEGIEQLIGTLLPVIEELQNFVWRRQLMAYFTRVASRADADIAVPDASTQVVGFVDMAGFTTLTRRASEADLRTLLESFESLTTDVVGNHRGRVVKTIGDEVLFVADEPADGAEIALELSLAAGRDDALPEFRAGLAAGPVVSRLGDVYGSTVNIASRLTSICRPGAVLVDRTMADALRDDSRYELSSMRPESVRGFHRLHSWRLRRAGR
jgi:adenylate cyclase